MVNINSLLLMTLSMTLGELTTALPSPNTPTSTSVSPAAASSIVAANPMVFPPANVTKQPIPGASSNTTLITVVPQLQTIVNKTSGSSSKSSQKRDVEVLGKRFDCIDQFSPWAPDTVWDGYALSFCNFYFPPPTTFWIPSGYCFNGQVPASGSLPNLNFNYCAKNPGVPYPTFVAVTNAICLAEFEGIVAWEDDEWFCPGFELGPHPGQIYGGDNFNDGFDSSNWWIYAS